MFSFFPFSAPADTKDDAKPTDPEKERSPAIQLLVIQADDYNWAAIFEGRTLSNRRKIKVLQCGWHEFTLQAEPKSRHPIVIHLKAGAKERYPRMGGFFPDFVLIRNEVYSPSGDFRHLLYGLMFANVPSLNSLHSVYCFCERPVVQGELYRLNRALGDARFPVVAQSYAPSHHAFMYTQAFPAVVKVGAAHAGAGKARVRDHRDMEDFRSVLAVAGQYVTAEPFLEGEYDLRIQKIGPHYRAYRRTGLGGGWKTNAGAAHVEDVEVTDDYRRWADAAAELFGGLDILTVDALHERGSGREVIMEVNGTSSGLSPEHAAEDNGHIADLVLGRMEGLFCVG